MAINKALFLLCFSLFQVSVAAQRSFWNKISMQFEYINKLDQSIKLDNNPESLDDIERNWHVHTGAFLVSCKINHHANLEIGYSFEPFEKGWSLLTDSVSGTINTLSTTYLLSHTLPLRFTYSIPLLKLFNRPLILEPSIGSIVSLRFNDGDIGGDGGGAAIGPTLLLIETDRKGIEYNIRKAFIRFEGRAQIRYEFSKTFALYFGGGYCQGTSVIGRENAVYTRSTATTPFYIKKEYKGTNVYFNAGLRVSLAGILSDQ
jgi:hypothetical protein